MGRIHVLPGLLVKKIAAGEVVERPASVVKELLENAVDAHASRVSVTVDDGGRQLIRVVDDGEGMSAEDLRLAVAPHATSKITDEDDLFAIATLGFRGEALASIGSVSRMHIRSCPRGGAEGHEIVVTGENIELSQAAGCPPGTSVEVRDLFFNLPARRKFLKGASTEMGHISEQFARIALAHPQVEFELKHNSRVVHQVPGQASTRDRVGRFFGRELADALVPISLDERGLRIDGLVAPPAQSRSAANWQYVFLNGRYIRDRFVQHAMKEAYRGLMEPNRHPVVFLFLWIDPAQVDVNVHPTKIEVRWRDSNLVHSQVLAALREKFLRSDFTPQFRVGSSATDEHADELRREAADSLRRATPVCGGRVESHPTREPSAERFGPSEFAGSAELWRSTYEGRPPATETPPATGRSQAIQLHNAYLVAQTEEGMVIIDQHALHERIMYDRLRRRIATGVLDSQRLLLPETIAVTPEQTALLETYADLLTRLGLEITPFGPDSVAVQACPSVLRDTDVPPFVRDLLDRLAVRGQQPDVETLLDEMLSMMACKAAVKFGDPLTPEEIDSLIAQRDSVEKSTSCPHGRPTALRFSLADLEKQFKRT